MTPTPFPSPHPVGARTAPVVIGAGLGGLVTALRLAPHPVLVVSSGPLGRGAASGWAQGGIAAALGDDDSLELHAADTLAAGAGLCEPHVVARITAAAPGAVMWLAGLGARFDRGPDGRLRLGLEGAHSRRRIVHAAGDGTGAEIMRAVVEAVRHTPSITVLEGALARRLVLDAGRVVGVVVEQAGHVRRLATDRVVLATGGSGQLWQHTTNPSGSRGQGLAMAARAGAELRDLEMVQFHPTALDVGRDPMPLVSEAVRGAGALIVDGSGRPLTDDPLAARDVVARVVWQTASRGEQVFLDARQALGDRFAERFPTVAGACLAAGVDPATQLIPVRPAAHYQCGGVTVDLHGRTTVPGLWAVGEVSSTGLHGANRLASNSLLEAVVCGGWVAEDLADQDCCALDQDYGTLERESCATSDRQCATSDRQCATPDRPCTLDQEGCTVEQDCCTLDEERCTLDEVRGLMTGAVGILRNGPDLAVAEAWLRTATLRAALATDPGQVDDTDVEDTDVDDTTLVALLVTHCAALRQESRGGHTRLDHPDADEMARHTTVLLADVLPTAAPAAASRSAHLVSAGAAR
ncbi:L-aspartate oxidase [Intrasporangium sp.]|uniref:L-aspartate oxidase n=1 Tax=Intrasporangium sp. TaxID=1925024 RepID=UPI0032219B29